MIIERRYNGPAASGNGGYTCGLVASAGPPPESYVWQVTLRTPPPLDTDLRMVTTDGGRTVHHGETLVAEAVAVPRDALGEPPPPVGYPDALAAGERYAGFTDHPFPTCYVCGPRRPEADGLRIFPGPLAGGTAATWQVPSDVTEVTLWAALDCPGGWAIIPGAGRPYVLGRMAAQVTRVPAPGDRCVVVGQVLRSEGRKADVRSAVYPERPEGGGPLAQALATWIAL